MPSVRHGAKYRQQLAVEALNGVQDESFFEAQLLRALSLALMAVGFDSVKPSALEAFRAEVDAFMQHFLMLVRNSMVSGRRTQTVPQDFIFALAQLGIKPHELECHLDIKFPPKVTQPPIAPAPHEESSVAQLDGVLGADLANTQMRQKWMPAHLPSLPSRHTYKHTNIYTEREKNARRIREMATEEGVLAEQAMRKLMINGGHGNPKIPFATQKAQTVWEDTMAEFTRIDEQQRSREDEEEFTQFGDSRQEDYDSSMLVNYERIYWRNEARGP